jgi:DNA-binding HxlR family transcriptional regulator
MKISMTDTASVAAKNILTNRLRNLVAGGILRTAPAEDGSRHQEYLLTQKGHGLFHVIVGVRQWAKSISMPKAKLIRNGSTARTKSRFVNRNCEQTMEDCLVHPIPQG